MRALINSLLAQVERIGTELPLLYDMAYRKPGPKGDEPRVNAPRIDPQAPTGDPAALAAWYVVRDRSVALLVRLSYVQMLHGLPTEPLAVGDALEAVAERLSAAQRALAVLSAADVLRADVAMTEQMTGRFSAPAVAPCVEQMSAALERCLPRPDAAELEAMRSVPCANCTERPAMKGRKRCNRCHTYFSRNAAEWTGDVQP